MTGVLAPVAAAPSAPAIPLAAGNRARAWRTEVVGCAPSSVPVADGRLRADVTLPAAFVAPFLDSPFLVCSCIARIGPCRTLRRLQRNARPARVRMALHDPLPRLSGISRT